ncbi:MAG TPA: TlpA disulfide reductase family protein [Opitutaceae bacterium]
MKTKNLLVLILVLAGLAPLAHARADKSLLGEALPALKVEYLAAKPELAGKPMILEFWATWCPPCRKSIPHLNELHSKYQSRGLVIVGVTKEEKKVVKDFLKKMPMAYFPAIDKGGALNKHFGVTGIPHAVLVDKSGKIVWEGHPLSLTDKQIAKVLE